MNDDWSDIEVKIIIADYFSMLNDETAGLPVNKTDHRKKIQSLLNNRSEGAIEFKHQNISAVLKEFGRPWIVGYKPLSHYQATMEEKVNSYIKQNQSLEVIFNKFAMTPFKAGISHDLHYDQFIDAPPKPKGVKEPEINYRGPVKLNYLEIEQNNRLIGNFGEEVVLNYEKWRLLHAGKNSLSDKIEWVAQTQGDGLGFDILSKNVNGTDRYIEVKTTKLGKDAPIFISKNEYNFSVKNSKSYFLYRLFNFNKVPKAFIVNGKFDDFCNLEAIKFRGNF